MDDPRIDHDAPNGNEVFVLRLEHATAGRVKSVITQAELDRPSSLGDLVAAKARGLAYIFEWRLRERPTS